MFVEWCETQRQGRPLGFDEGSGATGMRGPDLSKKEGYGYNGYTEGPGGTFGAIVTYAKSCHVSRELSPRTAKRSREMRVLASDRSQKALP